MLTLMPGFGESLCVADDRITQEYKDKAAEIVSRMTLEEKIHLIGGNGFSTFPIERLGIPEIKMADGPQGVRNNTQSTLYPCCLAASASWNTEIVRTVGESLGQDCRARGIHVILGPGVNIYRSPLCGRNYEYMGEDPFLAGKIAASYIKGVQSRNVLACVKHFALNNQEFNRHHCSSDADERTMNEIYFPAFRRAIEEGGAAMVMSSYNLVNNVHAAENPFLLKTTLRDRWGFDGIVVSDWTSTYSTFGSLKGGLDLEMPRPRVLSEDLIKPLLESGIVQEEEIDAKCRHLLQTFLAYGFFDNEQSDRTISEDNPASRDAAYKLACESLVLLKNDKALPFHKKDKIVLMGPRAEELPFGAGSGSVQPIHTSTLADGFMLLGKNCNCSIVRPSCSDGSYFCGDNLHVIEEADAVVLAVGFDSSSEGEYNDRAYQLPQGQDELICETLRHNKNVIVVVFAGGAIDVSRWIDSVSGLLWAWYPGQEGGRAIAEALYGRFSPSGRLPFTFGYTLEDNPCQSSYYPGEALTRRGLTNQYVVYKEGIFVGYRGYERGGIKPLYPFGYGLTYSDFLYSDIVVSKKEDGVELSFTIKNIGGSDASEVAQVYVGEDSPCVLRPAKELKGFQKTFIKKGESSCVKITLDQSSFMYYDDKSHDWKLNPGKFHIMVGSNVADIRLSETVELGK